MLYIFNEFRFGCFLVRLFQIHSTAMKNPITQFSFEWLIAPSTDQYDIDPARTGVEWHPYPIPKEIGTGGYETWPLSNGMSLFRGVNTFEASASGQILPLAEVSMAFNEPTFQVQSIVHGQCIHNELSFNKTLVYSPGHDLFRYCREFKVVPIVNCSENVEMIALTVGRSALNTLLGEATTTNLLDHLKLFPEPALQIRKIPLYVSHALHHALKTELKAPLRAVMAQAKALEYLAALSHYLAQDSRPKPLPSNRAIVKKLYDYLAQSDGKVPTLVELSKSFGRSAQTLNDEFQTEYGVSIYAFIQDRRLRQAHEAILNTDIALKQLSERLGYSHVNNFISAFKRHFGYAPGALRKR